MRMGRAAAVAFLVCGMVERNAAAHALGFPEINLPGKTYLPIGLSLNVPLGSESGRTGDLGAEVSWHRWTKPAEPEGNLGVGLFAQIGLGGLPASAEEQSSADNRIPKHLRIAFGGQGAFSFLGATGGLSYRTGQRFSLTGGIFASLIGLINLGIEVEVPLLYHPNVGRPGPQAFLVFQLKYPHLLSGDKP